MMLQKLSVLFLDRSITRATG